MDTRSDHNSGDEKPPVPLQSFDIPTGSALQVVKSRTPAPWSTGLLDCCDDVENCCVTCLCPCVTFGQIAEILDHGSTSCWASGFIYAAILCTIGFPCIYSCFYRSKIRGQLFLEENPFPDFVVHCCCESCALCQEYRELQLRGYDLHRGWRGNTEKLSDTATLHPATQVVMMR